MNLQLPHNQAANPNSLSARSKVESSQLYTPLLLVASDSSTTDIASIDFVAFHACSHMNSS